MAFIILDRDGVINQDSTEYIKSPEEWHAIPGSLEAIAELNRHGFRVLIATNQSGIARGYFDIHTLDRIHEKLMTELAAVGGCIEEIFFCPHHPDDQCFCRKPKPGLIQKMQKKYPLNPAKTFLIGDTTQDIEAAFSVGCTPMLVLTGKGRLQYGYPEVLRFADLAEAVSSILTRSNE